MWSIIFKWYSQNISSIILSPRIKREDLAMLREYENFHIRVSNMILGVSCTKTKRLHRHVPEPQNSPSYCNLLYRCEDKELFVDSGHRAWFESTYNRGCKNQWYHQHPAVLSVRILIFLPGFARGEPSRPHVLHLKLYRWMGWY